MTTTLQRRSTVELRRWVTACVLAEAVGMTAAATAARVVDQRSLAGLAALALVVAGGLIEGTALGVLQARALAPLLDRTRQVRWASVTVLVAGLGWAAASAPAALSGDSGGGEPPLLLVLLGAAALGAVMGVVLGAAQALPLRGAVAHPRRWVSVSALAWAPAMVVVFLGATAPTGDWPLLAMALLGAGTGALAGLTLGAVSGAYLPCLDSPRVSGRTLLLLLASPARRVASGSLLGLRVTGRRSGRVLELPVMYAVHGDVVVVMPGHPDRKSWWRNLDDQPAVGVLVNGAWRPGSARVLRPGEPGYAAARSCYGARYPKVTVPEEQPMVVIS